MKSKPSRKVFVFFNTLLMLLLCLLCLLPILHILAISLSEKGAVAAGYVKLFPVDFTLASYRYVMEKTEFWRSIGVTLKRLVLGSTLSIFLTILTAYPLSKPSTQFRRRTLYVWFLVITMLFNGGLIPNFMLVRELNLMDSIWALILPGIIPVFNVVLLLNFFRGIPCSGEGDLKTTIGNTQTPVRFKTDPDTYMDAWFAEAPTHHFAMSVGHNASLFEKAAYLMGIQKTVI